MASAYKAPQVSLKPKSVQRGSEDPAFGSAALPIRSAFVVGQHPPVDRESAPSGLPRPA